MSVKEAGEAFAAWSHGELVERVLATFREEDRETIVDLMESAFIQGAAWQASGAKDEIESLLADIRKI